MRVENRKKDSVRIMKKSVLFILCICSLAASKTKFNEYADINRELMLLPVSAALGGADLSISSGASFGSSPANLCNDTINSIELSYANFYQNTFSTSILSFSGPTSEHSGIGITTGYVYIPDIEDNRESILNNNNIFESKKITNASDLYMRFSYGYRFDLNSFWGLSAGAAANARRVRLIDFTGYGLGLDAGIRLYNKANGLSAVIEIENAVSNYTYWSKDYREYSYPHLRGGVGWEKDIPYIYGRIRMCYATPDLLSNEGINYYTITTDTSDQDVEEPLQKKVGTNPELLIYDGRIGFEYNIMNRLAFRIGLSNAKFNFGAGLQFLSNKAGLDFAYTIHQLAGTYQISMMYRW